MRFMSYQCALIAGMAISAAAYGDPGSKQAGGETAARTLELQTIKTGKKVTVRHATYNLATGQVSIGDGASSTPVLRGPTEPVLIWSAGTIDDVTGYYDGRTGAGTGGPGTEIMDWATLCGDPLSTVHSVQQFSFSYISDDDVGLGDATVFFYWNFPCAPRPNGHTAGAGCVATNQSIAFDFADLPGDDNIDDPLDEFVTVWVVDVDLRPDANEGEDFTFTMPAGDFGYGYSNWNNWPGDAVTATGGSTIADPNPLTGFGSEDIVDVFTSSPQTGYFGSGTIGGFTQVFMDVYAAVGVECPSLGACCLADLSCVAVEEAECTIQGGTFTSVGQACQGTFFCQPAPANDDCLGAEVISGFNQFNFDNRGATTGGEGASSCVAVTEDVWFSWQAHCTGSITLSTCLENLTDDAFTVYQGNDCGNLAIEVACDDDGCGVVGGQSSLTFAVTDNTNYLIRIGTWGNTDGGMNTFTIANAGDCVEGSSCDADWCNDGVVGVPDIFCFLTEWFALVPEARNYGGTPGVPAIFAFLSAWFANGIGPCVP